MKKRTGKAWKRLPDRQKKHAFGEEYGRRFLFFLIVVCAAGLFCALGREWSVSSAAGTGTIVPLQSWKMESSTTVVEETVLLLTPTPEPALTPSSDVMSSPSALLSSSPSPSTTPWSNIRLPKPNKPKLVSKTSTTITLKWKTVKKALYYNIYRKKKGAGIFKKVAVTEDRVYQDKALKGKTTYIYKIRAIGEDSQGKKIISRDSKRKKVTTNPVIHRTAYVGDSVMCGMAGYLNQKGQKVIAKIGISTWNFWRGDIMDTLLSYNPDRIYIMLGVNSLVGTISSSHCDGILADYKKIIQGCKKNNPDVEIIILSVAPCTADCKCMSNAYINLYNKKQKAWAKKLGLQYYDFSSEYKDSAGYLRKEYDGGDGLHWSSAGCMKMKKLLAAYDKKIK